MIYHKAPQGTGARAKLVLVCFTPLPRALLQFGQARSDMFEVKLKKKDNFKGKWSVSCLRYFLSLS